MATERPYDPDLEWIDHIRPTGLVVAGPILKERQLVPERQTEAHTAAVAALISEDRDAPALADPWAFFSAILGWRAQDVAGAPGGPPVPPDLAVLLPEQATTLVPDWAVAAPKGSAGWQMLVKLEGPGVDPDRRGVGDGWEATAHQRFERLLRETGVGTGVLVWDREVRLVHAPKGETSGWLAFPLHALTGVAGRVMLGGLKLLLNTFRLHLDVAESRLPQILKASREAQAKVSTRLAEQVLGALHELMRGFDHAEPDIIRALAKTQPQHLYEGLLTVLLRLVFLLYAEDRDLIPSRTDGPGRDLYQANYSVRGLFAKLEEDAALNPDTMDERTGAWGRLLATFRLLHEGDRSNWIRARGGKLFDRRRFGFLEGRTADDDPARVPALTDGCVHRVLTFLMTLAGDGGVRERLSYRTLDVEQIGSVYETVMGFTVDVADHPVLAIKAGKNNKTPVFVDLQALLARGAADRIKHLKDECDRANLPAAVDRAVRAAKDLGSLVAALDAIVDERGSPGRSPAGAGTPILQPTDERRRSGSHYTPRALTGPIVRHALEPVLARLGPDARPEAILDLKVCDPAMGSGAFLVEACRALATRLVQAWVRWPETRPVIPADEDEDLHARRLVAQRCLYGVDKNPTATDLAKLSLWLATLARDHEFTFLDHALKTGDSLVGALTVDQVASGPFSELSAGLHEVRLQVRDRFERTRKGREAIRSAPDNVTQAIQESRHRQVEKEVDLARRIGDAVIACFFLGDSSAARQKNFKELAAWLLRPQPNWEAVAGRQASLGLGGFPIKPFHWYLEFPEVFSRNNPGFDAIVGNPPFAGKNTIAASNRSGFGTWLQTLHEGAHGNADLVAHFFRRAFSLLRKGGVFGLIATNTIGQGDTRTTGLAAILKDGGTITHAAKRLKWPGEAAVVVSVVHVAKVCRNLDWHGLTALPHLGGRQVRRISAYLVEADFDGTPAPLAANAGKAFIGSYVLGMGFTFDDVAAAKGKAAPLEEMHRLIEVNPNNAECIFPYIGGEEINSHPQHQSRRYVMRLEDFSLESATARHSELVGIVRHYVKPARDKLKGNVDAERRRSFWWKWGRDTPALYRAIENLPWVLALSRVSPHLAISRVPSRIIFAETVVVFSSNKFTYFSALQCRIHEIWARFFSSTLEDRLRYAPSDCFSTFSFPIEFEGNTALEAIGQTYHDHRAALMVATNKGLTKTYNRFHDPSDRAPNIERLRTLHAEMDAAVLRAYGWGDLADRAAPVFFDDSTEDDFTYQGRLFWPADFRDEVLARLLTLNQERAADEKKRGVAPVTVAVDDDNDSDGGEGA